MKKEGEKASKAGSVRGYEKKKEKKEVKENITVS